MKKYNMGKGFLVVLVMCLLVAGGLSGYPYFKNSQKERGIATSKPDENQKEDIYTLVEKYDSACREFLKEYEKLERASEQSEEDAELSPDTMEEIRVIEEERAAARSDLEKYCEEEMIAPAVWRELLYDENYHDETKEKLRYYMETYVVSHTIESLKQEKDFVEFAITLATVRDYEDGTALMLQIADYFLDETNGAEASQKVGAAIAKAGYVEEEVVDAYTKDEKSQLAEILKTQYDKQLSENNQYMHGEILDGILALKRMEDAAWLVNLAETRQDWLESAGSGVRYMDVFCGEVTNLLMEGTQKEPNLENVTNLIRILNCAVSYNYGNNYVNLESAYLYAKQLMNTHPEKEKLPELVEIREGN